MRDIQIYTDGACSGNPGIGGWGTILFIDHKRTVLNGSQEKTTNNRMELQAAIEGLKAISEEPAKVTIMSDSEYLVNTMTKGWKMKANKDLWETLLTLIKPHAINWKWVKGHASHPQNEACDRLAREAIEILKNEKPLEAKTVVANDLIKEEFSTNFCEGEILGRKMSDLGESLEELYKRMFSYDQTLNSQIVIKTAFNAGLLKGYLGQ